MAFINVDGLANLFNFSVFSFFHDSGFMTFIFCDGGTLFFWLGFGDIPEALFAFCLAFLIHVEIRHHFWDFGADFLAFFIIPERQKLKITTLQYNRINSNSNLQSYLT